MKGQRFAIFSMLIFLTGCLGDPGPEKNNGWELDDDAGHDAGTDTGADTNHDAGGDQDSHNRVDSGGPDLGGRDGGTPPDAHPTLFRLTNRGPSPVFAYQNLVGSFACHTGGWLQLKIGDETQRIQSDCSQCSCEETECAVCALDCAPGAYAYDAQLGVGESREFRWDGALRNLVQSSNSSGLCEVLEAPAVGTPITARFCWGTSFEEVSGPFGLIQEEVCEEISFTYGEDVVEHELDAPPRDAITFRLTNGTPDMRYAHFSVLSPCSFGSWLRISQEDQELPLADECEICNCVDASDSNRCPALCPAAACAAPTVEAYELPPGASREHQWDGVAYLRESTDGMTCERDRIVTGLVTARLCWTDTLDESFDFTDEACAEFDFDPATTEEIVHAIMP